MGRVLWTTGLAAAFAAALAGCGAGESGQAGASSDAAYADTLDYCGSREPSGAAAQPGGWELSAPSHSSAPLYDVGAIVSPAGAAQASLPVRLQVDVHDYRTTAGSFLLPGYAEPQWKMGVSFSPVLPARSAACTVSLAKLSPATPATNTEPARYKLAWSSKWQSTIAMADLPGKPVDGFEFVGNVTPAGATAFFVVPKTWLGATQGLSICYRAPAATGWDCAAAAVADGGSNWSVTRPGAKPGVHVLVAPASA